jgi:protein TonB
MPEIFTRLDYMGHIVFKASKPAARGKQLTRGYSSGMREADAYNRSSLALDYDEEDAPRMSYPHLVSIDGGARSGVPDSPLWRGRDPFAESRGRGSRHVSFLIHVIVIGGVLWWGATSHNRMLQPLKNEIAFKLYDPPTPPIKPVQKPIQGGGGGGEHRIIEPQRGNPPKPLVHYQKMLPPEIARVDKPKLPVPPSLNARLPENYTLPNIGMQKSPQIAVASEGSGSNGFGIGMGGGMGAGQGDGAGAGVGGNYGGGVMNVGGGVSAPEVIHSVDPQFTAQARAANLQGTVSIQLIVDPQGNPQNVHVIRHLGMGLDQKAVEAVRQYKFKPAMYQGHPVAVQMIVDVTFHLH